jgi:beta-xylosidase
LHPGWVGLLRHLLDDAVFSRHGRAALQDLVNWCVLGHVVSDLTQIAPELTWSGMNRYGRGVWAGSIRHRAGKFRVYFGTPDEGYFMTTASNPAGPWEPLHRVLEGAGWDDPCPFWDDDGQGYLVGTSFRDSYKTYLWKLTPDGRDLAPESGRVIHQSKAARPTSCTSSTVSITTCSVK